MQESKHDLIDWVAIESARRRACAPGRLIGQQYHEEVKRVIYDFNRPKYTRLGHIEIIHLTDTQIGHVGFKESKFQRYVDWMLSVPNRFGILGGDTIDAATVLSKGSVYENTGEPRQQIRYALKLLRPLADAHRILGYVGGNHERRTLLTYGDAGAEIALQLGIPYSLGKQWIDIKFGGHNPFKISVWHGKGNSQTDGARAQMLARFMAQCDSHLYLVGHVHNGLVLPKFKERRRGNRIVLEKSWGIISTSFLEYMGSYAEAMALDPSDTMMGRAILGVDGKWEVTLK